MKMIRYILTLALWLALVLGASACGGGSAIPPVDLNAYATQVAGTVIAQITQTAAAYTPPSTSTPKASPTPTLTPTLAVSITPSPIICDNAAWVADVTIKDDTHMAVSQQFVKTWTIKNTGTCTWNAGYMLIFAYGEKMGGVSVSIPKSVPSGGTIDVSVTLTAPAKAGNYLGLWRLSNANGYSFGERLTVSIIVP
jgi:hypothetical protein